MEYEYKNIGSKKGHKVKVCLKLPARFEKAIGSPDGIVLFTSTVSHKMMHTAVKEAKRKNIPIIRCHTSSKTAFETSISQLEESVLSK